jgi:ABC-type nitrate/sulfonate/bicarbonate transport system permease component
MSAARIRHAIAPLAGLATFFALWQLLLVAFDVQPFVMPGPWRILRTLTEDPRFFWREGMVTAREAGTGLAIGLGLALVAAVPLARSRTLERATQPVTLLIQVIPLVCYAPAFVIWMRPGFRPIAAVAALVCFVPLLHNLVTGLRAADPDTMAVLRSVGASRRELLTQVELPSALPYLFAGLRTGVALSLIGAVIGEWFALVSHGLGRQIQKGMAGSSAPLVWGSAFALGAIGAVALLLLAAAERALLPATRSEQQAD